MRYGEETTTTISEKLSKTVPVILPVGAVEAHGPHLPLETDILLAKAYSDKLADRAGGMVLPVMPFGQVFSLRDFPGSITISNETLSRTVVEIGETLYGQGIRLFVLFSAHLGNLTALKDSARTLYLRHTDMRVVHMFYPDLQMLSMDVREGTSSHGTYIHADEIETSLMLYLAPEHVDMSKAINDEPSFPIDADYTPTPWSTFSKTAVLGDAKLATAEKGKYLVEKTLDKAVAIIEHEKSMISSEGAHNSQKF
jgi:creatinine amidohydrolase